MSVGVEEREKGEARERAKKSLLLINGGRRRGVFRPGVEMKRGRTPTAGLLTVNNVMGRGSVPQPKCGMEENMWESFASWQIINQAGSQSVSPSVSESVRHSASQPNSQVFS